MAARAGVYFLTSRSQWNDYVLPVYALSGAPASGAGIAFLVPGGLFELAFPGRVSRDDPEITHVGAGHGIGRSGPQG